MVSISATVLTGFIAWTIFLLLLIGAMRVTLVMTRVVPPNGFKPDNAGRSPFGQRLARAHANCLEGLPIFGGLLLVALVTNRTGVTDPLAPLFLAARIIQSSIHLASTSNMAVNLRFAAFLVQVVIALYWTWALLLG